MKNLTISKKLLFGFGMVLLAMIISILSAIYNIIKLNGEVDKYAQYTVPNAQYISTLKFNIASVQRYIAWALVEPENQAEYMQKASDAGVEANEALQQYHKNQRDNSRDEDLETYGEYATEAGQYRSQIAELLNNPTEANITEAQRIYMDSYVPEFSKMEDMLSKFSASAEKNAVTQQEEAEQVMKKAWIILLVCVAITAIFTFVIVVKLKDSILTPVNELVNVYEKIAQGDLKTNLTYESRDELGQMVKLIRKTRDMQSAVLGDAISALQRLAQGDISQKTTVEYPGDYINLKNAIEQTMDGLNITLSTINSAAEQVSIGSAQVSSGAQALAAGSAEQAASVEELNAAVVKIADEAEENSKYVRQASDYTQETAQNVLNGSEHMNQLSEAMEEIGKASAQITDIIKVIEDIAFQTNILALNAAIEAARAGSAGKGFAVVADEVRNLAAKSAEAAKQTSTLIRASVEKVERGSKITVATAQILNAIEEKATMTNDSMIQIDKASEEQVSAIEQIKVGLSQVSSVVQTNAATAEENSATSEEMSSQAVTLRDEVSKFKLSNTTHHASNNLNISLPGDNSNSLSAQLESIGTAGKY